ncbi:lytic transglycosylase domain-containing protein [Nocardia bovistercoris]|uniref:Lytic murein transglycosylase n=1 Tax=Nocardia bovistercoris TaxID=2785916 RepID=A0A931I7T3_9NOCA|nr:lytic murein transglycosylase [Nocardia bovistercoris]MBH0775337.1 lytic murein transglycosylase [Nocardia bovistercoris]
MRISAPITVSALLAAGVVMTGSAAKAPLPEPESATASVLAAAAGLPAITAVPAGAAETTVGLLPALPAAARTLNAVTPAADATSTTATAVAVHEISLPNSTGALGIPEIVLAAYRNAELAMASAQPSCGLSWNLLAGIGHIESDHAFGGRTDASGATTTPILGPVLDGTLPGNEVIPAANGGYVRALGPMQFLPDTWNRYAADGNGDGTTDPHNVFDAALGAGKYLCSGGLDLRDPAQELRAVLRYNNSMAYAADVLSWSSAYRGGGAPTRVALSPEIVPPRATSSDPGLLAVGSRAEDRPLTLQPMVEVSAPPRVTPPLVSMPGLTLECGVLCTPMHSDPADTEQPGRPSAPEPFPLEEQQRQPESVAPPTHQPSITLPMGIVIPLPMPQT